VVDKMKNMAGGSGGGLPPPTDAEDLDSLLAAGDSDLLYEGDGDWNGVFLGHKFSPHQTSLDDDDGDDSDKYMDIPKYVNELTGGKGYDAEKADKDMYSDVVFKGKGTMDDILAKKYGVEVEGSEQFKEQGDPFADDEEIIEEFPGPNDLSE
jgi:hypothetical protein